MDFTYDIPHRPPMVMLDSLVTWDIDSANGVKIFQKNDYACGDSGVAKVILIECLAQTVAAMNNLGTRNKDHAPKMGMLVGVKNFEIYAIPLPEVEIQLTIQVEKRLGSFLLVHGKALQKNKVIARGNLKFYIESRDKTSSERIERSLHE